MPPLTPLLTLASGVGRSTLPRIPRRDKRLTPVEVCVRNLMPAGEGDCTPVLAVGQQRGWQRHSRDAKSQFLNFVCFFVEYVNICGTQHA